MASQEEMIAALMRLEGRPRNPALDRALVQRLVLRCEGADQDGPDVDNGLGSQIQDALRANRPVAAPAPAAAPTPAAAPAAPAPAPLPYSYKTVDGVCETHVDLDAVCKLYPHLIEELYHILQSYAGGGGDAPGQL